MLCAALALSSACKKSSIDVELVEKETPVEFRAQSQATWVKSGTTSTSQTFPYNDFGVWGMARQGEDVIYNLWGNQSLTEVNKNTATGLFEPTVDAYWLKGYAYNFIAVAPYNDLNEDELTDLNLIPMEDSKEEEPKDAISFIYDISSRYSAGNYAFDLLGAANDTDGPVSSGRTASQDLTFWHLLSQINITVQFGKYANNENIKGTVDAIYLSPIPSGTYTISFDDSNANPRAPMFVTCLPNTSVDKPTISFEFNDAPSTATVGPINVIPQAASSLTFEIDITINEGTDEEPMPVKYEKLAFNLSIPGKLEEYAVNGKYNYTITIGVNAGITFDVAVQDWETPEEKIPEINM